MLWSLSETQFHHIKDAQTLGLRKDTQERGQPSLPKPGVSAFSSVSPHRGPEGRVSFISLWWTPLMRQLRRAWAPSSPSSISDTLHCP